MKLAREINLQRGASWSVTRRREAGVLLVECLIYLSVWSVLLGLSFAAFYRVWDNATRLRRSAADIARVLQAGERWREDVRQATGPLQLVSTEQSVEQALHVPQASGEVVYYFTGTNVLRRGAGDMPFVETLGGVKASRLKRDALEPVVAWRWEVELKAGKTKPVVRPLFTFQAVAAHRETP